MTQTKRTTKFPIEEIYTEADRAGSHDGKYTFYAPMSWAGDITLDKAVAVRRAKVIPPAMVIPFGIRLYIPYHKDTSNQPVYYTYDFKIPCITIPSSTTLYETLDYITGNFLQKVLPPARINTVSGVNNKYEVNLIFNYSYDNITSKLKFEITANSFDITDSSNINDVFTDAPVKYRFFIDSYNATYGISDKTIYPTNEATVLAPNSRIDKLRALFNQSSLSPTLFSSDDNGVLTLDNVWDREALEIHASFSNSKNRFIAVNGDFYQSRNMIFNARNGFNAFDVWFSTDGTHRINLRDDIHFILQLTFINHVEISIAKDY